jgi:hypothetical protein
VDSDPDFVFIVNYACPRCHASLETRTSGPPSWLRCPSCGRAVLPPDQNRITSKPYVLDETLIIGNFTTGGPSVALPLRPRPMAPFPAKPGSATSTTRFLLGTGFFATMVMFLFSLLDSNGARAGVLALICLVLLGRQSGRPGRN